MLIYLLCDIKANTYLCAVKLDFRALFVVVACLEVDLPMPHRLMRGSQIVKRQIKKNKDYGKDIYRCHKQHREERA